MTLLPILSIIYGGAHLIAWKSELPSDVEGKLWKIAAIGVMAGLPAVALSALLISRVLQPGKKA